MQQVNFGNLTGSSLSNGGSLTDRDSEAPWQTLGNPNTTYTLFMHGWYDITNDIKASLQLNYGYFTGKGDAQSFQQLGLVIRQDNAFLPASVRDAMIAGGIQSFTMGTLNGNNFNNRTVTGENYTQQQAGALAPATTYNRRQLMRGVFTRVPMAEDGQVLVNLGLIHRDNEVIPYWDAWLGWMRTQGWRRFAWYVWDQGPGMPGDWAGRFAPSFEFVFHFNRASRKPNKIVPCKHAGQESHLRADGSSTAMRGKDGEVGGWTHKGQPTQDTRIPDSVIRVMRHKGKIGQDIDHPAVFPVALPEFVIEAYSDAGDVVFEPFGGSGTTMLAAQRTGRVCRSVEIAPEYVDVAIKRFQQNHPGVPVTLLATGQSFDEVVNERLATTEVEQ